MGTRIDLHGMRFGQLTVIGNGVRVRGSSSLVWECRCECGNLAQVRGNHLKSGNTKSCGCMPRGARLMHGLARSRTYRIWAQMKQRCMNPANKDFHHYGGRGIRVCERWLSFENFLADMGESIGSLTLDRFPDSNGNYEPGNCRWASMKEQNRNRRSHVMVEHEGRTQCLSAWAEEYQVNEPMLRINIKKGLSLIEAIERLKIRRSKQTRGRRKKNSSGFPGVKRSLNKWTARVVVDGKRVHLGTFETAELASAAYEAARKPKSEPVEA